MTISVLVKGGLILDPSSAIKAVLDLRIVEGLIAAMGADLAPEADEEVLDASGLWITPGFIDLHTHLRDLGQADREDIDTGTKAAAAGGYTTVVAMANCEPPVDSAAILSLVLHKIESRAHIDVLPVACVTKSMAGLELTNMVELAEMGAAAFSDDGLPVSNLGLLRRALEYARLADRPIISHPEDKDLSALGVMHESQAATRLGLPGIPAASETAAVAREIEVVRQTGGRLHFAHISCAHSVELIRQAKAERLPVTADVTPHHLALTVEDIPGYDTAYKMNPPLRTKADQTALVAGLSDGTLDAIATDHAPHTKLDKDKPFDEAPFGVIGLETAFPVALARLVGSGKLPELEFIALFTSRAAAALGLPCPAVKVGSPADLAVFAPEHRWLYNASRGFSRSHNSAFNGQQLTGKSLITLYQGKAVYKDEQLLAGRLHSARMAV